MVLLLRLVQGIFARVLGAVQNIKELFFINTMQIPWLLYDIPNFKNVYCRFRSIYTIVYTLEIDEKGNIIAVKREDETIHLDCARVLDWNPRNTSEHGSENP